MLYMLKKEKKSGKDSILTLSSEISFRITSPHFQLIMKRQLALAPTLCEAWKLLSVYLASHSSDEEAWIYGAHLAECAGEYYTFSFSFLRWILIYWCLFPFLFVYSSSMFKFNVRFIHIHFPYLFHVHSFIHTYKVFSLTHSYFYIFRIRTYLLMYLYTDTEK